MTGYNKIKRTKLRKYAGGGDPNDPNYRDSDALGYGQVGVGKIDTTVAGNPTNQNIIKQQNGSSSSGLSSQGVGTGLNYLGDTVDSFNKGGTGGGSVALGTLSSGLKGAAIGTAILPGVGTAVGAGIGLVSGFFSSEAKRKQALIQQKQQGQAQSAIAAQRSNQVLRQYANNGVEDEKLYAVGGTIDPPVKKPVYDPTKQPTYDKSLLMAGGNKFITSEGTDTQGNPILKQWGNPVPNILEPLPPTAAQVLAPKTIMPARYSPSSYQNMGQTGRNLSVNPTPAVIQPSANYGGHFAKGGSIHIKPSHEGRFTAYKERTGETTAEALHSKNPHVRKMAQFASNAAKWQHAYGGRIYDDGGNPTADEQVNPQYEAEGGETVQGQGAQVEQSTPLASDIQQINGPSHEQGGVMGQGGDRIFSDRLKISTTLKDVLKTSGIKVGQNSTYADVSNKLGKLKGKFEDKTDGIGKQTAALMLPKIEQSLDDTFNDQEAGKNMRAYKKFAKGGNIKAMQNGEFSIPNIFDDGGPITKLNVQAPTFMSSPQDTYSPSPQDSSEQQPSFLSKVGQAVNDNSGQIMNAGTYLANLGTINRLNTSVNPSYLSAPNYNYVDRSGSALNRNAALLRTGVKGLTNNGNSVNASNIAALFAKTQEGNSYIAANENARKDAYDASYNDRADKVNLENTSIYNKASDDSRDLNNQKIAARLSARNAFQQGVVGNMAVKQSADLEQKKLLTVLAANDQNGVMTRFLKNYPQYKKLLSQYNSTSN